MIPPAERRPGSHHAAGWKALIAILILGAVAILAIFKQYTNSAGWQGRFPWDVYASGTAAWSVGLILVVAVLEIFGAVRLGPPRAAFLRRPWVPFLAILAGVGLGYLFWK